MKKKHKNKHNKKRNTAFLYEVLIQDITRSVFKKDDERKEKALNICKEFFHRNSPLFKEKEIFVSCNEAHTAGNDLVEKILIEAKKEYAKLDKKEIFNEQTRLINKVNRHLTANAFGHFISNYKNLATIAQILNQDLPVKERVLLENTFIKDLQNRESPAPGLDPTDNLVYKTFVKNYNEKYENSLLEEQKEIITRHATSFSDNGLGLKIFLNEELSRLTRIIESATEKDFIKEDNPMKDKVREVVALLESFRNIPSLGEDEIIQILEIQNLAKELES